MRTFALHTSLFGDHTKLVPKWGYYVVHLLVISTFLIKDKLIIETPILSPTPYLLSSVSELINPYKEIFNSGLFCF